MNEEENKNQEEEEFSPDIISEEEEGNSGETIKKLRAKLKESEKLRQEYLEGWQRAKADFVNAKRNVEKEKESFIKYSIQEILTQLIPVLDSFEMALKEISKTSSEEMTKGVKNIYEQLKTVLSQNGVQEISPQKGETFNPSEHEAVSSEEVDREKEDGAVINLFQKGYKLNDRIVRAAKVTIGEYKK